MLTVDDKINYTLDIEPTLFRDRYGTLLVKLSNGETQTVITDVTFYIQDNMYKLWDLQDNTEFTIITKDDEIPNTNKKVYITEVLEFIDVLLWPVNRCCL